VIVAAVRRLVGMNVVEAWADAKVELLHFVA
jgi:hypothetical protein